MDRQESGAQKLEGYDIMALERFDTEVGYKKALENLFRYSMPICCIIFNASKICFPIGSVKKYSTCYG